MATVIDISILNSMTTIVVFVLVFIGSWGVMMLVDPFKDKGKSFYGLLAFMLALLMVLSKTATNVVLNATPWLMVLALLGFFFIFIAKMFGRGDADISKAFGGQIGWIIFFVAVIVIFALGQALGPGLLAAQAPGQTTTPPTTPGLTVIGPDGTPDYTGTTPPLGTGAGTPSGTGTSDFGTNLVFTFFHPKILGVLFIFLLGTLAIIMLGKN